MTNDIHAFDIHVFHDAIGSQLCKNNLEIIGIQPIPFHTDKMVRLNTLQEILQEFEESGSPESMGYFLQVKHKKSVENEKAPEPLHLTDGTLNIPYLMHNAELLFEAADFSLARSIYNTILKSGMASTAGIEPGRVLCRIANCLESEGKLEEARLGYEEAITYFPTLECYQHLASILTRQSKDRQAAEILERALNLKGINTSLRFNIHKSCGNSWTRAKKSEEAENHFKAALEITPSSDEVRSNLGTLYLQEHRFAEAKRCFWDAIASNSCNHLALSGLGSCALAEGEKEGAHDYFAQSLEIDLNNPTAIFYIVKCSFEIKSYARACRILEKYIQIVPVNSSLLYSLAGLRFHLGRFDEAKDTVSKILELQPQHPGAKELLTLIQKYASPSV